MNFLYEQKNILLKRIKISIVKRHMKRKKQFVLFFSVFNRKTIDCFLKLGYNNFR
jgi:hypothetical protein